MLTYSSSRSCSNSEDRNSSPRKRLLISVLVLSVIFTLPTGFITGCSRDGSNDTNGENPPDHQTDGGHGPNGEEQKNSWRTALNTKESTSVNLSFSPPETWMVERTCRYEIRFPDGGDGADETDGYVAERNYEVYTQSPEAYNRDKIQAAIRRYRKGFRMVTNPVEPPPRKPSMDVHPVTGLQVFLDRTDDRPIVTRQANMPVPLEGIVMPDTGGLLMPGKTKRIGDSWKIQNNRIRDVLSRMRLGGTVSGTCKLVRVKEKGNRRIALINVELEISFPTPDPDVSYRSILHGFLRVDAYRGLPEFLSLSGPVYFTTDLNSLPETLPAEPGTFHFSLKERWYR